jgi:hypothetical protein
MQHYAEMPQCFKQNPVWILWVTSAVTSLREGRVLILALASGERQINSLAMHHAMNICREDEVIYCIGVWSAWTVWVC